MCVQVLYHCCCSPIKPLFQFSHLLTPFYPTYLYYTLICPAYSNESNPYLHKFVNLSHPPVLLSSNLKEAHYKLYTVRMHPATIYMPRQTCSSPPENELEDSNTAS